MVRIVKSLYKFEDRFDQAAQRFASRCPYLAFWAMFVGVPVFILIAVCLCTAVTMLPVAWLMGWIE